jgi:hypothetical protein
MEDTLTLYKFRSLNNFEFIADIILNQRVYAAQFFDLNDPMEGLFKYTHEHEAAYIDEVVKEKKRCRICSFSRTSENILMWSHYADGFRGVCIEVKVPASGNDYLREEVHYVRGAPYLLPAARGNIDIVAQFLLTNKNRAWELGPISA